MDGTECGADYAQRSFVAPGVACRLSRKLRMAITAMTNDRIAQKM
jgi:hypothetical protein